MNKIFNKDVDRFYFCTTSQKKVAIISYEYRDEFGLHNITTKVPYELGEFQTIDEKYLPSEYIFISLDVVDIGIKAPFPMVIRIKRLKSERGKNNE